MTELTMDEMANIQGGWSTESFLCSAAITQLGFWNGLAFGYAFGNLPGALVGLGISLGGSALCELISS